MLEIPLLKACLSQQQALEELIGSPKNGLDRETLADAVQLYASYAMLLDRVQRRLLFRKGMVSDSEVPALGHFLTGLIESAIARGHQLREAMESGDQSRPVDRGEDLATGLRRLKQLLDIHLRGWPNEPIPTREEVLAQYERGETQTVTEAFAEIAGLSVEAWERRVEEYRKKRKPGEGAA